MLLNFDPKTPNESNSQFAYRVIRNAIMTMVLKPGTVLNDSELSDALSISRTPIRSAIAMLKDEYLVDVYPQHASIVSLIDLDLINEGCFMRNTIEPAVFSEIIGKLSMTILSQLKENLALQRIISEESSNQTSEQIRFLELDDVFHHLIYTASNKNNIWKAMKRVSTNLDRLRFFVVILGDYQLHPIYDEHVQLFNILLTGNEIEKLNPLFSKHLTGYRSYLPLLFERYPNYFTKLK